MKCLLILACSLYMPTLAAQTPSAPSGSIPCQASINGFKIKNVYIVGDHYNAVVWAYKHIAEATCLTPVTNLADADAILELYSPVAPVAPGTDPDVVSVSCSSTAGSSVCRDSTGNVMTVDCSHGSCTSYYGPDPTQLIGQALTAWIMNGWSAAEARIYTVDHKLLWRSMDTKGDWPGALWPDKVRLGTNSPVCKCGAFQRPKYKTFRNWASTKCGVEFTPLVSIDLKVETKQAAVDAQQKERDQMVQNAREAAATGKQQ